MAVNYVGTDEKAIIYPGMQIEDSLIKTMLHNCDKTVTIKDKRQSEDFTLNTRIVNEWINTGLTEEQINKVCLSKNSYILKYDFSRLSDYLAFEIGHVSFDLNEFSTQGIDDKLKDYGLLYPTSTECLDEIVPDNFASILLDYAVDADAELTYCFRGRDIYKDYFMNSYKFKGHKYVTYDSILSKQNKTLAKVILYYILLIASNVGVTIKLLHINEHSIYILVNYNEFVDEKFNRLLKDSIIITVCGRKFEYFPNITVLNKG